MPDSAKAHLIRAPNSHLTAYHENRGKPKLMTQLFKTLSALSWGIIVCTSGSASADDSKFQIKDSILGTNLVAIQTALPESLVWPAQRSAE